MTVRVYAKLTVMPDECPLCGAPRIPADSDETRLMDYVEYFCGSNAFMRGDGLLVLRSSESCIEIGDILADESVSRFVIPKLWKHQIFPYVPKQDLEGAEEGGPPSICFNENSCSEGEGHDPSEFKDLMDGRGITFIPLK